MRRIIILAAMAWSMAMLAKPKAVGGVQATETPPQVSPHEIMVKQVRTLPVEYWPF